MTRGFRTPITLNRAFSSAAERVDFARSASAYLDRLLKRDPVLLQETMATLHEAWSEDAINALVSAVYDDEAALKRALRLMRQRVVARLWTRDLAGLADLHEVVETTTQMAEIAVRTALAHLYRWHVDRYGEPIGAESRNVQTLIIIGFGKLGGRELNVSSDIDLISCYPEDGATAGDTLSNIEFFTTLTRKLIGVLSEMTEDGYVFRVDLRLRPYGDSGPLVGSFAMLETYYQTQGREWERYAWIKARPLVGDRADELMQMLRPFVYRRYLDFGAFGSMRELHAQIRSEVRRRDLVDDIKRGPGGIRELEFSVQVFQLIRGGQDANLRTTSTRDALKHLGERGLLPSNAVSELEQAYLFLRSLEHRLQYRNDQQTHRLPNEAAQREALAASMGFADLAQFEEALRHHRARVSAHFDAIFSTQNGQNNRHTFLSLWESGDAVQGTAWLDELGFGDPAALWDVLARVRQSSRYRQLPDSGKARFDALLPLLIEGAAAQAEPEATVQRLLQLLESIGRREAYLALLNEYPQALKQVIALCGASPWAAHYLAQHPLLLDELIDPRALDFVADRASLEKTLAVALSTATDTGERMDALRHFKHSHVFRLLAQDLAGGLALETLSDRLSDVAEVILQALIPLCWDTMASPHVPVPRFAIIAYGKLGGRELGYASDLDLVFLYHDEDVRAPENYARLAQRINTWLTSLTPAGTLYETDLRLRPNGASGLLVSDIDAFEAYQRDSAWIWEHQALTRARAVAGDVTVGSRFETVRRAVLQAVRTPASVREAVIEMREKMLAAHPNASDLFDIKHDRGGLVDAEFSVQYLVLTHAHDYPDMADNAGNIALLGSASRHGLVPSDIAQNAQSAYRTLRSLQHAVKLRGEKFARIDPVRVESERASIVALWHAIFG